LSWQLPLFVCWDFAVFPLPGSMACLPGPFRRCLRICRAAPRVLPQVLLADLEVLNLAFSRRTLYPVLLGLLGPES
jgi:hypothetical protein